MESKSIYTLEQIEKIKQLHEIVNNLFNDIIKLGGEAITDTMPDLETCTLNDCIKYNDSTNLDKINSKAYSLRIEINSYNALFANYHNIVDIHKFKMDLDKRKRYQNGNINHS